MNINSWPFVRRLYKARLEAKGLELMGGPRPQARNSPQATSAQGTSNKLIGHKPQAWGGSRPQARGSRSLHKVL